MIKFFERASDLIAMLFLCLKQQLGSRFMFVPLAVLIWPIYQAVRLLESQQNLFTSADVQNNLLGLPIYLLAIGLGIGIIAKEIERGTLEVVYTIPGGAQKIWLLKLAGAALIIIIAELLLAVITSMLFTSFPISVLYRTFQAAVFFLVLSMGAGALFRSELAAGMFSAAVLFTILPRFSHNRWSPLFDPLHPGVGNIVDIVAWSVQNHIGIGLLIIVLIVVTFKRAERRELLLD